MAALTALDPTTTGQRSRPVTRRRTQPMRRGHETTADAFVADQVYTATLQFAPHHAEVGAWIEARGEGYPAGATVELAWYTVVGRYELEGGTEYAGQRFDEHYGIVATARADEHGVVHARFQVPVDFGGPHDVRGRVDGRELSQASLTVNPTISISPARGPIGTPIEVRILGVDWRPTINTWHLLYDNRYVGYASAVTTRGVAIARFRAAGPVGNHYIQTWNNAYNNTPYLAWDTSPFKDIPGPGTELTFRVTRDRGPSKPKVEDFSALDAPWESFKRGPAVLEIAPDRCIAGTRSRIAGRRLPPWTNVTLKWWTTVGNRITGGGYEDHAETLAVVRTDDDGCFTLDFKVPDDLGGQHRVDAVVEDILLGSVGMVVLPSLASFGPRRARAGEKLNIHLKGLGWTTYDNTYTVVYDNAHIGYVCGFSTNGDVRFELTATGGPGTHLVDLYPTIYRSKDPAAMPRGIYSVPQLTYAEDHPGRKTPAVRLSFEIVP